MQLECFNTQMKRLSDTYGAGAYPPERSRLFWRAYTGCSDEVFREAVDFLIANNRSAPMAKEFDAAIAQARALVSDREWERKRLTSGSVAEVFDDAARQASPDQKELVAKCQELLRDKISGRISMAQFLEGCDLLEKVANVINPRRVCSRCSGDGYVTEPDEQGYRVLRRCSCQAGAQRPETAKYRKPNGELGEIQIERSGCNTKGVAYGGRIDYTQKES